MITRIEERDRREIIEIVRNNREEGKRDQERGSAEKLDRGRILRDKEFLINKLRNYIKPRLGKGT